MKVGDYVRTDIGIGKYISDNEIQFRDGKGKATYRDIIKSSPNIIDLIEVGDYVNGERVTPLMIRMRDEQGVFGLPDSCEIYVDEIKVKSIVTKEQFESMEYKINKD